MASAEGSVSEMSDLEGFSNADWRFSRVTSETGT